MDGIRPILYGVSDYALLRKKNGWFVDRTAKIRHLENTAYAMFLRPRRFGKSFLVSILEAYYDIDCADRFDELFAGTDIGANPTEERNSHLILYFNFSAVAKRPDQVEVSFEKYVRAGSTPLPRSTQSGCPRGLPGKSSLFILPRTS